MIGHWTGTAAMTCRAVAGRAGTRAVLELGDRAELVRYVAEDLWRKLEKY
jgi:hypothetical protein